MRGIAQKAFFDMSACKWFDFEQYTCGLKNSVFPTERDFLSYQRSERLMVIAFTYCSNKGN